MSDRAENTREIAPHIHAVRQDWGWRLIWIHPRPSVKRYETFEDAKEAYRLGKVEWTP